MVHMLIKIFIINIYDNYQSYWSYGGEILPKNMHLWRSKTSRALDPRGILSALVTCGHNEHILIQEHTALLLSQLKSNENKDLSA